MSTPGQNSAFENALREVDRLASMIAERGYDNVQLEWDDYDELLQTYEFRKLVTFELYDAYFPPKRHEFELSLLTQLVDAVVASKSASFIAGAAVAGIVGSAAYDMLKKSLSHIAKQFTKTRRTHDTVQEIGENIEKLRAYMDKYSDVTAGKISSDLDIEAHKIEPLLKLLGCRSHRVKKRRLWVKPPNW